MILLGNSGREFRIEPRDWDWARVEAIRHGWVPKGTLPPPEPLELGPGARYPRPPWNAAYLPALGQMVTRSDAASFARALERVAASTPGLKGLESLARFCRRSGFLVCEQDRDPVRGGLLRLAGAVQGRAASGSYSETLTVTPA